ncbi:hypothetical protein K491DRAFT_103691 [Lophiostoma macrostomum CBS 122681]|uniref:Heterokaryon incompatibility domain-containing protein n=1 Tax=Lophiostoma macrostomum CBS 122681 TaxID=1314788 RepID=A0A6A6SVT2_9PLEO|nr:hypothetical protein K491DRAFT_103691 [Lophiostoma macrostomum CBS 122681]
MDPIYGDKLQAHNPAIRILTLLPGPRDAVIKCLLARVAFDKAARYDALSYAWGDPSDKTSIAVNGFQLFVPSNLSELLRMLRKPDNTTELWADAICINQKGVEEKNYQVSIMGEIFRRCDTAYIWLGFPCSSRQVDRNTDNAESPFALISHFAYDKHLYELPCFEVDATTKKVTFHHDAAFTSMWDSFVDIFQKPWWSRFWCIQESLLPSSAIVMLGPWTTPWSTIKLCEKDSLRHIWGCCGISASLMPPEYTWFVDAMVANSQVDPRHVPNHCYDACRNMDQLVRTFRYKDCQNPRDKIYGISGLLNHSRYPRLLLDYSLPIANVYTNAMEAMLCDGSGDLRCLTGTGFNSQAYNLPSWVRNFQARPHIAAINSETHRDKVYALYNASSSAKSSPILKDEIHLVLNGVWIDNVRKVGSTVVDRN